MTLIPDYLQPGTSLTALQHTAFIAGCPTILARQWPEDSAATTEMISEFYAGMEKEKLPAAVAWQRAMQKLAGSNEFRHPLFRSGVEVFSVMVFAG
jgi:CHAT domain-containing protein